MKAYDHEFARDRDRLNLRWRHEVDTSVSQKTSNKVVNFLVIDYLLLSPQAPNVNRGDATFPYFPLYIGDSYILPCPCR